MTLQGCGTLIFGLLLIVGGIAMIFVAIGLLILMVALFLSFPFGTLAYLAVYGVFDRGGASIVLSLLIRRVLTRQLERERDVEQVGGKGREDPRKRQAARQTRRGIIHDTLWEHPVPS